MALRSDQPQEARVDVAPTPKMSSSGNTAARAD
jgi:hypothetical protein